MSVIMHFAGSAGAVLLPEIRHAFENAREELSGVEAFEGAELLVNHREGKVQFLLRFRSYEECNDYLKKSRGSLLAPFKDLLPDALGPFFFALEVEIEAVEGGGHVA